MKNANHKFAESVIKKAMKHEITTGQAAARLGCTKQYINKLKKKYQEEGSMAFQHGNSGKPKKWRIPEETRKRIIDLYSTKYVGFNFRHFLEKLNEEGGIKISYKPLYNLLNLSGFKSPMSQKKKRKENIHPIRPRRQLFGELLQIDATIHPWFGDSVAKATLHGAIDDSTGVIMGLWFDKEETLGGYYEMFRQILIKYGIPEAFYGDNRTIFEYRKLSEKNQTIDRDVHIQFQRCCQQLGVELITTSVSQAKGKIERLWKTLQSRLLSELRLRGIKTIDKANSYLPEFMSDYNKRFASKPNLETSVFAPSPSPKEIDFYLSIQYQRKLDNGCSFRLNGRRLQMCDHDGKTVKGIPGAQIDVYITLSKQILVVYDGKLYEVKDPELHSDEMPKKIGRPKWRPGPNHPWKKFVINSKKKG